MPKKCKIFFNECGFCVKLRPAAGKVKQNNPKKCQILQMLAAQCFNLAVYTAKLGSINFKETTLFKTCGQRIPLLVIPKQSFYGYLPARELPALPAPGTRVRAPW